MIKIINLKTLGLAAICLASILFFAACDSSPQLSASSKETGFQSVETITSSLPKSKAEEFSSAIQSIEEGMNSFLTIRNTRKLETNAQEMMRNIHEAEAYRPNYKDKIWAKLNGMSVNQIISLGKDADRWNETVGNCSLIDNLGKFRGTYKAHLALEEFVLECLSEAKLEMPAIFQE
jgi:hypothetical protein